MVASSCCVVNFGRLESAVVSNLEYNVSLLRLDAYLSAIRRPSRLAHPVSDVAALSLDSVAFVAVAVVHDNCSLV